MHICALLTHNEVSDSTSLTFVIARNKLVRKLV